MSFTALMSVLPIYPLPKCPLPKNPSTFFSFSKINPHFSSHTYNSNNLSDTFPLFWHFFSLTLCLSDKSKEINLNLFTCASQNVWNSPKAVLYNSGIWCASNQWANCIQDAIIDRNLNHHFTMLRSQKNVGPSRTPTKLVNRSTR